MTRRDEELSPEITVRDFVYSKIKQLDTDTPWARGMLAKLRRGVGKTPSELPELWTLTLADMPEAWYSRNGEASKEQNAVHAALTFYALHRQGKQNSVNVGKDSLGAASARLVNPDKNNLDAVKRRFDAVVTAIGFLELCHHARGLVQLLKDKDIYLDYPRFSNDLLDYQHPHLASGVRLRWGQDFYGVLSKTNDGKDEENK